ncbi:MAG: DNA adenine methylase [Sphingobacterium sp.]|nr:DNA adenine methylase [Sphingobacterium sp.]
MAAAASSPPPPPAPAAQVGRREALAGAARAPPLEGPRAPAPRGAVLRRAGGRARPAAAPGPAERRRTRTWSASTASWPAGSPSVCRWRTRRTPTTRYRKIFNALLAAGLGHTVEAASLFYYLNRTGFNGLCRFNSRGEFNVPFGSYARIAYVRDFSAYRAGVLPLGVLERSTSKRCP